MTKAKKFGIVYLIVYGIMLFLNYWSATDVGSTADSQQSLIQPAGYAFSIWGVIYLSIFLWIIRLFFIKTIERTVYEKIKVWLILNFILNAAWILTFTADMIFLSTLIIAGLLFTLIMIYRSISAIRYNFFDRFPFSLYFGWVTVATLVNIFTLAVSMGTKQILGLNEISWTNIMLVVATGLCIYISIKYLDWLYPLVFVWSFTGIAIENSNAVIIIIAGIGIVLQLAVSGYAAYRSMKRSVA